MEVKPGYKQTEVGVIPEDWEVRPIGDDCRLVQWSAASSRHEWRTGGVLDHPNPEI